MTSILIGGGIVLAIIAGVWLLIRHGKAAGEAETRAEILETDAAARDRVAKTQAEARGPEVTEGRLRDGSF